MFYKDNRTNTQTQTWLSFHIVVISANYCRSVARTFPLTKHVQAGNNVGVWLCNTENNSRKVDIGTSLCIQTYAYKCCALLGWGEGAWLSDRSSAHSREVVSSIPRTLEQDTFISRCFSSLICRNELWRPWCQSVSVPFVFPLGLHQWRREKRLVRMGDSSSLMTYLPGLVPRTGNL